MLEILRDQIWQFVGATFGFAAIIISIILWRTQRRRKALSYEIISRTPLLSVEDEVKGKVQILFDGKPVQDIHLAVIKMINSGNVPMVSADYERPVNLSFGESAQILTAEILETDPDNLQASVDIEATRVVLEPVLLNGGDSITLKLLVSQLGEISVDGRIVGLKDIQKHTAREIDNRVQSFLIIFAFGLLWLMAGINLVQIRGVLGDRGLLPVLPPLELASFYVMGGMVMLAAGIILAVLDYLDTVKIRLF